MRLIPRRWLVPALLVALLAPASLATPLALETHAVTSANSYVTREVVVDVAGTLTLLNVDLPAHDIVAVASGPADNPWCGRFAGRACPLFASPLVGLGEQAVVEGTDQLAPLASYDFYCSVHPWMTGTLTAL